MTIIEKGWRGVVRLSYDIVFKFSALLVTVYTQKGVIINIDLVLKYKFNRKTIVSKITKVITKVLYSLTVHSAMMLSIYTYRATPV